MKMVTLVLSAISTFSVYAQDTVLMNQDHFSVANSKVLIERTEMTPNKVKIEVPIAFHRQYCAETETHTHHVPCPTNNGGSGHSSGGNHSGGGSPRPPHGGNVPPRPPHSEPRPPHHPGELEITLNTVEFNNYNGNCTETYTECVRYATRTVIEDRTFTLKFKKDARAYKGAEIYELVGVEAGDYTGEFGLTAVNDLAKSHELIARGRKHFVLK